MLSIGLYLIDPFHFMDLLNVDSFLSLSIQSVFVVFLICIWFLEWIWKSRKFQMLFEISDQCWWSWDKTWYGIWKLYVIQLLTVEWLCSCQLQFCNVCKTKLSCSHLTSCRNCIMGLEGEEINYEVIVKVQWALFTMNDDTKSVTILAHFTQKWKCFYAHHENVIVFMYNIFWWIREILMFFCRTISFRP